MQEGPPRIVPESLADYVEVMSQTVFWVGISWKVVKAKWPRIREAFRGFDPVFVANLNDDDIDKLAKDERVIRHRGKLQAIVYNSQLMVELDETYGSFRAYLRSLADKETKVAAIRQLKYLGEMSAYQFLWSVGEIDG